jgi:hypothetical protein
LEEQLGDVWVGVEGADEGGGGLSELPELSVDIGAVVEDGGFLGCELVFGEGGVQVVLLVEDLTAQVMAALVVGVLCVCEGVEEALSLVEEAELVEAQCLTFEGAEQCVSSGGAPGVWGGWELIEGEGGGASVVSLGAGDVSALPADEAEVIVVVLVLGERGECLFEDELGVGPSGLCDGFECALCEQLALL